MKLNITIDVNEIFEDGLEQSYLDGQNDSQDSNVFSLKESIQQKIIMGVKNSISKDCMELISKKATSEVDKAIDEAINKTQKTIEAKAVKFADDWLEKEVTLRDEWGEDQECMTITDIIKRSFENLMDKKVNPKGQFEGYDRTIPLYKYLTEMRVEQVVSDKLKDLNKDIDKSIADLVNAGIRTQVSNKFAEMVVQTAKQNNFKLESNKG